MMTVPMDGANAVQGVHSNPSAAEAKLEKTDPHLVFFRHGDPECPFYFPAWKKAVIVGVLALQVIWSAGIGAAWSANAELAREFGTSEIAMRGAQAMYLVGSAVGPIILTPLAEDYGRKLIFTVSGILLYLFQLPIALAPNYGTLVVFRFLGGVAASPLINSCCNVPDLWKSTNEFWAGIALNVWALSASMIIAAPVWGVYISDAMGWRWLWGITGIVGAVITLIFFLAVPETRHSVLLTRRARALRTETGDDRYHALGELSSNRSLRDIVVNTFYRPLFMLLTEPIVNLFAIYDGLNYGLNYIVIVGIPIIFPRLGVDSPQSSLLLLFVVVGYVFGASLFPLQWRANQRLNQKCGTLVPEGKLLWGIPNGALFPLSIFMFGWLSIPGMHWAASIPGLILFGVSSHILFFMTSDYTVESYGVYASSAVTGQSAARELLCAALIIVSEMFIVNVGPEYTLTILGAMAIVLGALPLFFFKYGHLVRARSHMSLELTRLAKENEARARQDVLEPAQA